MQRLLLAATIAAAGLGIGGALAPAQASSACAADAPVAVAPSGDGIAACVNGGTVDAVVTATPDHVVADGDAANPEPLDGYVGVDGTGPVACASGDYEPGGDNNPLVDPADPAPGGECSPQAPQ
jgi:hypothetical protein